MASGAAVPYEYLVLATPDAGFSSPSLQLFFDSHPAFHLETHMRGGQAGEARIYSINSDLLSPVSQPLHITEAAHGYLQRRTGDGDLDRLLRRMNPSGFVVTPQ